MQIQFQQPHGPVQKISKHAGPGLTSAIRFGKDEQDGLSKSGSLAKYPTIGQFVFKGKAPNETPLTKRPMSKKEMYNQYRKMIVRRDFREHYRGPIPFIGVIAKAYGAFSLVNPKAIYDFSKDVEGQQEYALLEDANETAYEYGVARPMAFFKQGELDKALSSFQVALDAAPGRLDDTYLTLANFCADVARFQDDVKKNRDFLEKSLSDTLEFLAFNSGLVNNRIVPEKGDQSKMGFSFSSSFIYHTRASEKQPVNLDKLRKALKESTIPFRKLAEESFRKTADMLTDDERDISGKSFGRANLFKVFVQAQADHMAGQWDKALEGFKQYFDNADYSSKSHQYYQKPYARALRDAGKVAEAVEVWGRMLKDVYTADCDDANYHEFFNICEDKAQRDNLINPQTNASKWSVALPYLKAAVEDKDEDRRHGLGYRNRVMYLGMAYENLGQSDKAIKQYEKALSLLERWPKSHYPEIAKLEEKIEADLTARIEALSKKQ